MQQPNIKPMWQNHPLAKQGKVELVPTEWVWQYWGSDVSPEAELLNKAPSTMNEMWEEIVSIGLHDPLIMRVGLKNMKMRLEAGNHRIQVLRKHGVKEVPVTVQIQDECGPHLANAMTDATVNFNAANELLITESTEQYLKPSLVFKTLSK